MKSRDVVDAVKPVLAVNYRADSNRTHKSTHSTHKSRRHAVTKKRKLAITEIVRFDYQPEAVSTFMKLNRFARFGMGLLLGFILLVRTPRVQICDSSKHDSYWYK